MLNVRAWDKETEVMWTDVLMEMGDVEMYDENLSMWEVGHMMREGDDSRFDFMRNIDFKDQKGEQVYEKDIVSTQEGNAVICYDRHQGKYKAVPIVAYLTNAGNGGWTGYDVGYINEVLGDIYHNAELLTKAN